MFVGIFVLHVNNRLARKREEKRREEKGEARERALAHRHVNFLLGNSNRSKAEKCIRGS